jgi:SAM-dependent methyltransferase
MFHDVLSKFETWLNFWIKKENRAHHITVQVPDSLPAPSTHRHFVEISLSEKAPLLTVGEADEWAQSLRQHLYADSTRAATAACRTELAEQALRFGWWQRLKIPGLDLHTTSDHKRLQVSNPGWLNTLGDRLTPEEGFILRPMPKWAYLKRLIPDLSGKSVLEFGCNNGFFSFKFVDLGANHVTGVDVYDPFLIAARWMKSARQIDNVEFILTDALLDLRLPEHDIVFMSEVHGHFVDPLFGILRAVNLARETLIIDGAALPHNEIAVDLSSEIEPETKKLFYHAWIMSDGLMLKFLFLCGVEPQRVKRYVAPWPNHIVYVVDTRNVAAFRKINDFQPGNTSFINMRFSFPSTDQ